MSCSNFDFYQSHDLSQAYIGGKFEIVLRKVLARHGL